MPLAQYMQYALGHKHAVTNIMHRLADANLSTATKARQQEQRKLQEVMHAHMDACDLGPNLGQCTNDEIMDKGAGGACFGTYCMCQGQIGTPLV